MTLKELLGESYKDGITLEEIETALADRKLVDPSTLPKSVDKTVFDKTASELSKVKKELKELQETSMTEDEKLKEKMGKADELQARYAKELSKLSAREIFVSAGLKDEDYDPILETVVTEDAETTKDRARKMVALIATQKEAVDKAVRKELLDKTPKPPGGKNGEVTDTFQKQIEEAKANGDMATVAALIRQEAMSKKE